MRLVKIVLVFVLSLALIAPTTSPALAESGVISANAVPITNELSPSNVQSSIQSVSWYDGLIQYSNILNCVSIIQGFPYYERGMGTYVGFTADPQAASPGINQVYYVHVIVAGLGNACSGQRAFIDIQLPPGTTLAIAPSTPVYCFAGGNPLSPAGDCPQTLPTSPYNAGAYAIYSPDAANNYTWPIPQGAFWEFQIPVRSNTMLSGSPFRANVLALDGNDSPWLRPEIGVFVFSNTPVVIYPSPSTETTQNPDLTFTYKSQAYVYTFNQTGTAYFDLGTSAGVYGLKTDSVPITTPGTAWSLWDDWVDPPFTLLPNTTYHWRVRFVSTSGPTYVGTNQTFTTLSTGNVTLGDGTSASCNTTSLNTALNTVGLKELDFDCGSNPISIAMALTRAVPVDLKINGGNVVTLVAPTNARHFDVSGGAKLTLENITLSNGNATTGCGGAIRVSGNSSLVANRVSFLNNNSQGDGGALCVIAGSQATLNSSLFSRNTAIGQGGAIYSQGSLSLIWTDVSRNSAGTNGGGIAYDAPFAGPFLDVFRSLISENAATGPSSKGGGLYILGNGEVNTSSVVLNTAVDGAGIYALNSTPNLQSATIAYNRGSVSGGLFAAGAGGFSAGGSIIALNQPANCVPGQTVTSFGYNLENSNTCGLNGTGDIKNVNPQLDSLRFNGGASRTVFLKTGSPALDAGNPAGCGQFDQRGFYGTPGEIILRAADGNGDSVARCDIGALERLPGDTQINDIFLPLIKR